LMSDKVKLIAVTKPVDPDMDAEKLIAYIARVSNPKNQDNHDTAAKLLKYCVRNKHWSIFEMVNVVLEVNCTRAIGRQMLRHGKAFGIQEFSQRYAEVTADMFTTVECRMQDPKNRQNSIVLNSEEYGTDMTVADWWEEKQNELIQYVTEMYKESLEKGIAKEQVRAILPEGLTMSKMYFNGSLRSWIHYCQLRMANGTQKEHQDIAKECWEIILGQFPSFQEII
jgi:thymidylate synthase (FAD)